MPLKNQVQLITYPDSLGGDLKALHDVLTRHFADVFRGGVHILPPFPSSGDRGFAPLTYLEIAPEFGSWADIRAIGAKFDILVDLMVNHISQKSAYFQDFLAKGKESEYADLFITLDKIWENGEPVQEDIDKIFLRRPRPYSTFTIAKTGEQVKVWTTFGKEDPSEQIDLDVKSRISPGTTCGPCGWTPSVS
jgi:sucrose phosphorylase